MDLITAHQMSVMACMQNCDNHIDYALLKDLSVRLVTLDGKAPRQFFQEPCEAESPLAVNNSPRGEHNKHGNEIAAIQGTAKSPGAHHDFIG